MEEEEGGYEEEQTTDAEATDAEEGDTTATDVTDTEDDEASKALQPSPKKNSALAELMVEDLEVTDSQVMIQLKEAENEAESVRREVAIIKAEIERYRDQEELGEEESEDLQQKQLVLVDKLAYLEQLTKRIERLMRLKRPSEEPTILDEDSEEEEEGFPDDLLPRVVICSSWDDMMPKVVVCMDMKKPGAKKPEGERDENGLTPEQRDALEQERRCMAEERNRLQYQIASLEGEMRVMMRENDVLSRKIAQLKADAENQPPFEFEMSVSATNPPGVGRPKTGDMDMGFGVMGPGYGGAYHLGAALAPGAEVQGRMAMPTQVQIPVGDHRCPCSNRNALPCGGPSEIPGRSAACPAMMPAMAEQLPQVPSLPPMFGKRCRKEFNECPCSGGMMTDPSQIPPKQPPMDLNFKVNVQPQSRQNGRDGDAVMRSNRVAQQLQEIEMEVRRMQRELSRAKKDKETLKAQQATLHCAKTSLM